MTFRNFKTDCQFSFYYALLRIGDELGGRLRLSKLSNAAHSAKEEWITRYLRKNLGDIVAKFQNDTFPGNYDPNAPVWVCWWTGEDSAPDLVKQCIRSIRKQAGNRAVHFIDQETYSRYITIPDHMLTKVADGKMGLAHLADYIRVCLLAKYGGLWIDATIFCTQKLPESYFTAPVFTCKSEYVPSRYISGYRWTTFCLGGHSGHGLYQFLQAAFEQYWSNHDYAIDYLLFDHLIYLAYTTIPAIRADLDAVPVNNPHRDDLQAAMNAALPAEMFDSVIQPETVLYKLSWRETYSLVAANGEQSILGFFLNM